MSDRVCKNILSSYIEYTANLESPDSYHIWSFLSVVASCLRRQKWVSMGYFKVYPNMYIVLVGPPGRCKKSVAINVATGIIDDLEEIKISADAITREALIRVLNGSTATIELAPGNIYPHSSLTIVSKELSVFLGTGNHDLLALLTDLYDCPNKWEYRTKNMGVDTVNNVWLNMLAASTPDWLVGSIPITAIGGGFTSRVIFVVEQDVRRREALPTLSEKQKEIKQQIRRDLELISMMKGEFILSPEAKEFYISWYNDTRAYDIDKKFWGYMERRHIHLLKTSMLISACSNNQMIITYDHIKFALNLLLSIEPKMIEAFGAVGRSVLAPDIGDVAEVIRTTKVISKKNLVQGVWRDVAPDALDKSLVMLKQMGYIKEELSHDSGEILYKWNKEETI